MHVQQICSELPFLSQLLLQTGITLDQLVVAAESADFPDLQMDS